MGGVGGAGAVEVTYRGSIRPCVVRNETGAVGAAGATGGTGAVGAVRAIGAAGAMGSAGGTARHMA